MSAISKVRLLTYPIIIASAIVAWRSPRVIPLSLPYGGDLWRSNGQEAPAHYSADYSSQSMTVAQAIQRAETLATKEGVALRGAQITAATLRFKNDRATWYIHFRLPDDGESEILFYTVLVDCASEEAKSISGTLL